MKATLLHEFIFVFIRCSLGWYCRKSLAKSGRFEKKKPVDGHIGVGVVYRRDWVKPSAHYGQRTTKILLVIIKANKELTMGLKRLYSWPKKLYQFTVNMFFWLIYQLLAEYNTKYRRVSHIVAFIVAWLALQRDICPCNVTKLSLWYASTKDRWISL